MIKKANQTSSRVRDIEFVADKLIYKTDNEKFIFQDFRIYFQS